MKKSGKQAAQTVFEGLCRVPSRLWGFVETLTLHVAGKSCSGQLRSIDAGTSPLVILHDNQRTEQFKLSLEPRLHLVDSTLCRNKACDIASQDVR